MTDDTGAIQADINNQNSSVKESVSSQTSEEDQVELMQIIINGEKFLATLEYNSTAEELKKRLPLTITMSDFNNEKFHYFSDKLPQDGSTGDIFLYGSDCLALFYDNLSNNFSYTRIGKISNTSNIKKAIGEGSVTIDYSLVLT